MAEPDDKGEGGPRTEQHTGPTNQIQPSNRPRRKRTLSQTDIDQPPHDPGPGDDVTKQTRPTADGPIAAAVFDPQVDDDDDVTNIQQTPTPHRSTRLSVLTPARFMLDLMEGSPVGEYEIQSQIGEGAMGTVYTAIHPLIGKTVAIKVLKPELCSNQASIDRFVQEAQAVNRIGHPNIVDVFMLGELPDGRAYFVMEWLRGEDLKSRLSKGRLTVGDTCNVLTSISRALEAAHGKDVVHRDLKPDNVFLHAIDDGPIQVKLLDFGIAKLMREKASLDRTQTGNMLGTPRYISPEQARGVDVTHRSDIYSLGVMAYEMLAGRPPFLGETGMDLVVMHLNEPPPPLQDLVRLPKTLSRCVMSMLAKDPSQRPTLGVVRKVFEDPRLRGLDVPRKAGSRRWVPVVAMAALGALAVGSWQAYEQGWFSGGDTTPEVAIAPVVSEPVAPKPDPAPIVKDEIAIARGTIQIEIKGSKDAVLAIDGTPLETGKTAKMVDSGPHEITATVKGQPPITQMVTAPVNDVVTVVLTVPDKTAQRPVRPPVRPVVRPPVKKPPPEVKKPASDLMTPKDLQKPKASK